MKMKRKKKTNYIIFMFLLIFINVFLIINYIGSKVTPKVNEMVVKVVNKNIYKYVFNLLNKDIMSKSNLENMFTITKNKYDEIVSIDYNFYNVYEYLSSAISLLYDNVEQLEVDNNYYDKDTQMFFVPLGYTTDNILLTNLGSKIPCKVNFLTDMHIGFKTKVTNYGINNVLVELYINVETKNSLINPLVSEDFGEHYEIVVASKIIVGSLPDYFGGEMVKSSSIVSS